MIEVFCQKEPGLKGGAKLAEAEKKVKKMTSAEKNIKQSAKRKLRNIAAKSELKSAFKKAGDTIAQGKKEDAATAVRDAMSLIDSDAKKGIIHRNKADRKKSRLAKKYNNLLKS